MYVFKNRRILDRILLTLTHTHTLREREHLNYVKISIKELKNVERRKKRIASNLVKKKKKKERNLLIEMKEKLAYAVQKKNRGHTHATYFVFAPLPHFMVCPICPLFGFQAIIYYTFIRKLNVCKLIIDTIISDNVHV